MPSNKLKSEDRCAHLLADGRRCALPRAKGHDSFCLHHWRSEESLADRISRTPQATSHVAEALGSISQLNTTTAVNDALAKLFTLRARKLISSRDTVVLSYVIQLLLQTLHGTKDEFTRLYKWSDWDNILDRTIQKAIGPNGSLQTGIPDRSSSVTESLHRRKRSTKLPATRQDFGRQVLTEYLLSKGLIEETLDDEAQEEAEVEQEAVEDSDDSLPAEGGQGLVDDIVKPHEFVVHNDPHYSGRRGRQGN